ncbi:hypothetical protein SBV1_880019 [Verrucomicrobia bacterium]|nr:hypothetical protein SBV1_880019 [Verrucomicrobiota bacterium]
MRHQVVKAFTGIRSKRELARSEAQGDHFSSEAGRLAGAAGRAWLSKAAAPKSDGLREQAALPTSWRCIYGSQY